MRDDRLRLIFTCCHPALATGAQVALTLRLLGGLTTAEIARAFLVPEPTMAQRLVRAKGKIRDARIPYRVPERGRPPGPAAGRAGRRLPHLQRGLHGELGRPAGPRRTSARRPSASARLLAELMPDEPEVMGLLALMLLVESRRAARTTAGGDLVLLADQDRGRWDRDLIAEGQAIVRHCLRRNQPGPYQIQAAINAVHSDAPTAAATDWSADPAAVRPARCRSPRARSWPSTARSRWPRSTGPEAALALVDGLDLDGYHLFHAIRADLLRRLGRDAEAALAYEAAIARTENAAEREFLQRRRQALAGA